MIEIQTVKIWKFGDDVDTDQIVPGRFSPYMNPDIHPGEVAFIEARPDFRELSKPGDLLVAGENFGCGSSREYAPLALKERKIGAVIAKSYARIFYRNAVNLGLPIYEAPGVVDFLFDGDEAKLDMDNGHLWLGRYQFVLPQQPRFARNLQETGGILAYYRQFGALPEF